MAQSLTQLPRTATIHSGDRTNLIIRNHRVVFDTGMFYWLQRPAIHGDAIWKSIDAQFYLQKISYEAAVEWCALEIKEKPYLLAYVIEYCYDFIDEYATSSEKMEADNTIKKFSASNQGMMLAEMFIDGMRMCDNWTEFHNTMKPQSDFRTQMRLQIAGRLTESTGGKTTNTTCKKSKFQDNPSGNNIDDEGKIHTTARTESATRITTTRTTTTTTKSKSGLGSNTPVDLSKNIITGTSIHNKKENEKGGNDKNEY